MDAMHLDIGHFYERSKWRIGRISAFARNILIGIPYALGWVLGIFVKFVRTAIAAIEEGYSEGSKL